ncbi:UDP-N-acetyl-D-mannosamine dehydrogenase [compost metagenome]
MSKLPTKLEKENITLANTENAIRASDIVLLLVDHKCFGSIDRNLLKEKVVIDTRGFIS